MAGNVLRQLLRGQGAHTDPVAVLADLSAEVVGLRLPQVEHTIWQQVVHMNYWMDYEIRSIEGPEPSYPEHAAASWPERDAPQGGREWETERKRFEELVAHLERLAEADERTLSRIVHPKKRETALEVVWQMAAHNSYHIGQVALLRRAFGRWPPPGGGDSW